MSPAQWVAWQFAKAVIAFIVGSIATAITDNEMFSALWWIVAVIVFLVLSGITFLYVHYSPDSSGSGDGGGSWLD